MIDELINFVREDDKSCLNALTYDELHKLFDDYPQYVAMQRELYLDKIMHNLSLFKGL